MQHPPITAQLMPPPVFAALTLCASALALILFLTYAGVRRTTALTAWTATLAVLLLLNLNRLKTSQPASVMAEVVFILTAVPFALRLYSKWRNQQLTDAERAPGSAGFRAWFSLSNLVMALLVSAMGYIGFGWSLPLLLLLTLGSLALWPVLNPAKTGAPLETPRAGMSAEREKVLSLLESGKISAEEAAELLNALRGGGAGSKAVAEPVSRSAKLTMVGAALVLLGFLFPWFTISPTEEVSKLMSSFTQQAMPQEMREMLPSISVPSVAPIQIHGAHAPNGLGWVVLAAAIVAALLPYFGHAMHRSTLQMFRLLSLGIGSAVLIYLAAESPRYIAVGLEITSVGIFIEWIGLLRNEAAAAQPAFPAASEVASR